MWCNPKIVAPRLAAKRVEGFASTAERRYVQTPHTYVRTPPYVRTNPRATEAVGFHKLRMRLFSMVALPMRWVFHSSLAESVAFPEVIKATVFLTKI